MNKEGPWEAGFPRGKRAGCPWFLQEDGMGLFRELWDYSKLRPATQGYAETVPRPPEK